MYKIKDNVYLLNRINKEEKVFEGEIPLNDGMSYNSYIIKDEKIALLDTTSSYTKEGFLKDVESVIDNKPLDYLVIHHVEPDHSSLIKEVLDKYPQCKLVLSNMALTILKNLYRDLNIKNEPIIVKEGDTLNLGKHKLVFYSAPMVHWPEVMVSYDTESKILFSADAFGSFGAYEKMYSDEIEGIKDEERRYYTNIVSRYGVQVQNLLKKLNNLDIEIIASLHGPLHKKRIPEIVENYNKWSLNIKEKEGILVIYTTIYGNTEDAANYFIKLLIEQNVPHEVVNLNDTDIHLALSKSFIYSDIVLFSPTFNTGIFPPMRDYLSIIKEHNLSNKRFGIIENGSWAPSSGAIMESSIKTLTNCKIDYNVITIKSSISDDNKIELKELIEKMSNTNEKKEEKKVVHKWRCKICGYVYVGESLPENFKCPICGHPASDFVQIQ